MAERPTPGPGPHYTEGTASQPQSEISSLVPPVGDRQRWSEASHEQLVGAFQSFIRERQREWKLRSIHIPTERLMLDELALVVPASDRYSADPPRFPTKKNQEAEFFKPIYHALNLIAYEQHGANDKWTAAAELGRYYEIRAARKVQRPEVITLDPQQMMVLDALAEAVDIPHIKGQAALAIPEKLRDFTKWQQSGEYEAALGEEREEKRECSRQMQEGVFDKLQDLRPEENLSFKPIDLMNQLRRELSSKAFQARDDRRLAKKLTARKESVQRIEMAYEILAFYSLNSGVVGIEAVNRGVARIQEIRETITDAFEHPGIDIDDHPHRAPIALDEEERRNLGKLTQAMELPFDPTRRTYRYTDLAHERFRPHPPELAEQLAIVQRQIEAMRKDVRAQGEKSGEASGEPPESNLPKSDI